MSSPICSRLWRRGLRRHRITLQWSFTGIFWRTLGGGGLVEHRGRELVDILFGEFAQIERFRLAGLGGEEVGLRSVCGAIGIDVGVLPLALDDGNTGFLCIRA